MAGNYGSTELQKTAKDFLHGALFPRQATGDLDDIAQEVINLILGDEPNPLTDLIKARYHLGPANGIPTAPKPPSSKLSFRFSRNRDKSHQQSKVADSQCKPSSSSEQEFQTVFQAGSASAAGRKIIPRQQLQHDSALGKQPSVQLAPSSPEQAKARATVNATYSCCFCQTGYSVKGTCKRHLEEIHVAKRYYLCEKCRHTSPTVPEAKKHSNVCSVGVLGWTTVKPSNRQVYSSEFTNQLFSTQQRYIDHLLELCVLPKDRRPRMSYHMKLRNLLDQRMFEAALHVLSCRLFGRPKAWREVRWEHKRIHAAVWALEHGKLEHHLDAHDLLGLHRIKTFLDELFADRLVLPTSSEKSDLVAPSSSNDSQRGTQPVAPPSPGREGATRDFETLTSHPRLSTVSGELNVQGSQTAGVRPTATEPTNKRPLSYETAMRVPDRQPPGPPAGGTLGSAQASKSLTGAQPVAIPGNNFAGNPSYGPSIPAWSYAEQPPPYDNDMIFTTGSSFPGLSGTHRSASPMMHNTHPNCDLLSMNFVSDSDFTPYRHQDVDLLDVYPKSGQLDYGQACETHSDGSRDVLPYQPSAPVHAPQIPNDFHPWFDFSDVWHGDSRSQP